MIRIPKCCFEKWHSQNHQLADTPLFFGFLLLRLLIFNAKSIDVSHIWVGVMPELECKIWLVSAATLVSGKSGTLWKFLVSSANTLLFWETHISKWFVIIFNNFYFYYKSFSCIMMGLSLKSSQVSPLSTIIYIFIHNFIFILLC